MKHTGSLFLSLNAEGGDLPSRIELVPAGELVAGRDGRTWKNTNPAQAAANSMKRLAKLPIDENHATDLAAPRGGASPAFGWITALNADGRGAIFADVEWTARGRDAVANKEIKRLAVRAPAVLTSFMRYTDENHSVDFVSWVLCRADSKDRLYDGALNLVSALIPVIRNLDCDWSVDAPCGIEAECLYSGALDQMNVTLWGVRWRWRVAETALKNGEGGVPLFDLDNFEGYDAAHHVGDGTAKDSVNMED